MSKFKKTSKVKIDYIVQNTSNIHTVPLKFLHLVPLEDFSKFLVNIDRTVFSQVKVPVGFLCKLDDILSCTFPLKCYYTLAFNTVINTKRSQHVQLITIGISKNTFIKSLLIHIQFNWRKSSDTELSWYSWQWKAKIKGWALEWLNQVQVGIVVYVSY